MTNALLRRLSQRAAEVPVQGAFEPVLFDVATLGGQQGLSQLLESSIALEVCDRIDDQIRGLLETRDPAAPLDPQTLRARTDALLDGREVAAYGNWVYYPWSRRLVHVLPEAEFRELRTSRNRNKITLEEQERLRRLRIGIVGLSIGQAAAVTLTLEEVGGYLALADFDALELSNMNRLRAGVHSLGVNKAVLAAREVYEINPYARVSVWSDGVNESNLDEFLQSGGAALDLVYEECDDLQMKVLVREHARRLRIPVLMETSDRGLMDIERFDLEPERPIFHGLVGDVRASDLRGMTTYQKVPLVMRIIGREGMSDRMAASMIDVETTLKSWPQLASEVALGAGLNVDTARRIALGELRVSGRFYVDVESVIRNDSVDHGAGCRTGAAADTIEVSPQAQCLELPPLRVVNGRVDHRAVETLTAWATTAYSGGNCQPWSFHYASGRLTLVHDVARSRSLLDVDNRASYLAFGACVENIELAARAMGMTTNVRLFPDEADPFRICDVELGAATDCGPIDALVDYVGARVTNRRLGVRRALEPTTRDLLSRTVELAGCRVQWLETDEELAAIASILGHGDRLRFLSRAMHSEMMGELRWSKSEVERTRDGLDLATLEMTPTDLAGMRVISAWPVMQRVARSGGGHGLERPTRKAIAASAAVGLLSVKGRTPQSYLQAGRALQRLWLEATAQRLAVQPMTALCYMFYRLEHAGGVGLDEHQQRELRSLRTRYRAVFHVAADEAEPMLFRVGYADAPTARSLRRPLAEVLHIHDVRKVPRRAS